MLPTFFYLLYREHTRKNAINFHNAIISELSIFSVQMFNARKFLIAPICLTRFAAKNFPLFDTPKTFNIRHISLPQISQRTNFPFRRP